MNRDDIARRIESVTRDTLIIRSHWAAALDHLEDTIAGYPTQTVGADPNTAGHELPPCTHCHSDGCTHCHWLGFTIPDQTGTHLTGPEHIMEAALAGQQDHAFTTLTALRHDIHELYNLARSISGRIDRYWTPGTRQGRNADAAARAAVDNLICRNHGLYGHYRPIDDGGRAGMCSWCYRIATEKLPSGQPRYGEPPDRELVTQAELRGARSLSTRDYEAFVLRCQDRKRRVAEAKKTDGSAA